MKASKLDQYLNNPPVAQELGTKSPSMVQTFWSMHKDSLTACILAEFSAWLSQMAGSLVIVSSSLELIVMDREKRHGTYIYKYLEILPELQFGKMRQ